MGRAAPMYCSVQERAGAEAVRLTSNRGQGDLLTCPGRANVAAAEAGRGPPKGSWWQCVSFDMEPLHEPIAGLPKPLPLNLTLILTLTLTLTPAFMVPMRIL